MSSSPASALPIAPLDTPTEGPASCGACGASGSSYYQRHVFFCLNQRSNGEACCASQGAQQAFDHCKSQVKAAGLTGPGQVRVNKAGCLDRCAAGPVLVIYPEAVWYSYVDKADIDEIVESHLKNGEVVQRLLVPPNIGR